MFVGHLFSVSLVYESVSEKKIHRCTTRFCYVIFFNFEKLILKHIFLKHLVIFEDTKLSTTNLYYLNCQLNIMLTDKFCNFYII